MQTIADFIPIFMQIAFAAIFVVAIVIISNMIGPKYKASRKSVNFECGLDSIGNARSPFDIKYFLVAILFVIFDIEVIFMYPWAINFQAIGASGMLKMIGFIGLLLVGFLYIIKKKALEWSN